MQDRPSRRKELPDQPSAEPGPERSHGKQVRIELKGPLGCLFGAILLAVALVILVVAAFTGLIALAVAFWIAAGFIAFALLAALLRAAFR